MKRLYFVLFAFLAFSLCTAAQDKPRVFMAGHGTTNGMSNGSVGGSQVGKGWWAAGRTDSIVDSHDESMELAKDFASTCPGVQVTVNAEAADYVTSLNRESKAKKGLLSKNDQIMVSNKAGDVLLSSTVRSVATAAKDACNTILADFAVHGHAKPATTAQLTPVSAPATPADATASQPAASVQAAGAETQLDISSKPDGADIEIDGRFMGNTPSTVSVPSGDHIVTLRMPGCQTWKRSINTGGGKVKLAAVLPKADSSENGPNSVSAPTSLGDAARAVRARHTQQPADAEDAGSAQK